MNSEDLCVPRDVMARLQDHEVYKGSQAAQLAEPDPAAARLPGQEQRLRLDAKAGGQVFEHHAGVHGRHGQSKGGHCNALQKHHLGVKDRL